MSRCSSRWLQNEATTWELEFLFSVFVFSFLVFCLSIRLYTSKAEVVSSANHNKPRLCDEPITAQHQLQSARNRQEQISCAQNLKLITKSLKLEAQNVKLITKKGIAKRKDHIQIKTTRNQIFQMTIIMVNIWR